MAADKIRTILVHYVENSKMDDAVAEKILKKLLKILFHNDKNKRDNKSQLSQN